MDTPAGEPNAGNVQRAKHLQDPKKVLPWPRPTFRLRCQDFYNLAPFSNSGLMDGEHVERAWVGSGPDFALPEPHSQLGEQYADPFAHFVSGLTPSESNKLPAVLSYDVACSYERAVSNYYAEPSTLLAFDGNFRLRRRKQDVKTALPYVLGAAKLERVEEEDAVDGADVA
uniref:Uncharacterized protein n=1 Tax=Mycena chlorophos TaxID=658473 RepID=A0ABQ0KXY6_MYCCL|nr:predicted protein [Mycena chlorophos]